MLNDFGQPSSAILHSRSAFIDSLSVVSVLSYLRYHLYIDMATVGVADVALHMHETGRIKVSSTFSLVIQASAVHVHVATYIVHFRTTAVS